MRETGISSPASGWELSVQKIDSVSCETLYLEKIMTGLMIGGFSCDGPDAPTYILRLSFVHPEKSWHRADEGWAKINKRFKKVHGVDLNERLITKITHMLSISCDDLVVAMNTNCRDWVLRFVGGKVQTIWDSPCNMKDATKEIDKGIDRTLENSSEPSSNDVHEGRLTGETVVAFMDEEYERIGATVKNLDSDSQYAEVIIEGIRGEVVEHQNYWERLQATFFIAEKRNTYEVRLLLDGQYAAGISQPPLSAYIDMEPSYATDLEVYAELVLTRLKNHLKSWRLK
jgi:hypothetical protein